MATNGTALPRLTDKQRKALAGPPIGTGFDALADRLFTSFDGGAVFDYGPSDAEDFRRMLDRDGKAAALEQALTLPLRSAPWDLHPAKGDTGETEFVTRVLESMSSPMPLLLGQVTSAVTYRKSFHEKVWKLDDDGRVVYDKLAYRPPATCQLARDAKTAAFRGFRQRTWWTQPNTNPRDPGYVDIPANRALVYLHNQHRDPLRGTSDLEVARWCHETRQKLLFVWYAFLEKQSLPWVVVYGATEDEAHDRAEQVATLKSGGVVGLPQPQQGQKAFEVLDASVGQGAAQFEAALKWLDAQMSMSVLAGWIDLPSAAAAGRGSLALSTDQTEMFMTARRGVLGEIGTTLTEWLVRPLVAYNFPDPAKAPAFKFGPISEQGASETVTLLQAIAAAPKVNLPASFVEELVVRAAGLLDLDTDKVRKDAAEAADRATAAAPTEQAQQVAPLAGAAQAVARHARAAREPAQPTLPLS